MRQGILVLLWLAFASWTCWETVDYIAHGSNADLARYGLPDSSASLFALNAWAFGAALLVALIAINPFAWLNGKRLAFGATAFMLMLGRLFGGGLVGYGLQFLPIPGAIAFALMPFVLLFSGLIAAILIFAVVMFVIGIFVIAPASFFAHLVAFENALHIYRYQARGLAGYVVRFMFWLRNEPLPPAPPDESKGARFATRSEALARHNADTPRQTTMAFGQWMTEEVPFYLHTEKHVLIMASTRSGKGVTLIIPHLLRYPGSAFVLDPKGENAKATGRQRAELNNFVHYLDPFGITGKPQSRFNPLSRFTPDNMEAESKALAAALFMIPDGKRDHWEAAGQQLLAALILYVYVSPDIPPTHKDLPQVRKQLLGNVGPALKAMMHIDDADGLLRDLAESFLQTPEKEFGSIVSSAQRQTEILDNPFMAACLTASGDGAEVDFNAWHTGTMTVYLCLSAPKFPTFNRWLRLVLTSALDEMTDTLNPPPLPVCFMLDELATLGHLEAAENAVGLAAGYGIQLITVFQDVAQMRDLYKGRWASFIGNAGVRALFNLDDYDTAKYWSDFVGGTLVETRSTQQDIYGLSGGSSVSEALRPLIPPDKLMMDYAAGKMLVLATGMHPIETRRVAYYNDPRLEGLWDDPRVPVSQRRRNAAASGPSYTWGYPPASGQAREPEAVPGEIAEQRESIAASLDPNARRPPPEMMQPLPEDAAERVAQLKQRIAMLRRQRDAESER